MHKELIIQFNEFESLKDLAKSDQLLLEQALYATHLSYSPYSNFKVGAAARLSNGEIILGSNLENASYGAAICAERVLLSNLLIKYPHEKITDLALMCTNSHSRNGIPVAPCGICRQSLFEHEANSKAFIRVIIGSQNGKIIILGSIADLIPLAFNSKNLT